MIGKSKATVSLPEVKECWVWHAPVLLDSLICRYGAGLDVAAQRSHSRSGSIHCVFTEAWLDPLKVMILLKVTDGKLIIGEV